MTSYLSYKSLISQDLHYLFYLISLKERGRMRTVQAYGNPRLMIESYP